MRLELVCVRGEERDCWTSAQRSKASFPSGRCLISQVIVDHGLQQCDLWSRSPDCYVVSVTNPLDRGSWPWHISYVIVEQ